MTYSVSLYYGSYLLSGACSRETRGLSQAPRLIGPNSEKFRIPRLPFSPTAGEKNSIGEGLIKKIRARFREEGEESGREEEEEKVYGSLLPALRHMGE